MALTGSKSLHNLLLFRRTSYQSCLKKISRIPRCWKERGITTTSARVLHQKENSMVNTKGNIIRSRLEFGTIPDVSFCEYIFPYFEKHGKKTFLIDGITGKSYSFLECLEYCHKVASGLKKLGLQTGDIVGLFSFNRPEYIIAWLAISMAGGIITEVNPIFTAGELKHQLQATDAAYIVAGIENVATAKEALQSLPKIKKAILFGEADGFIPFSQLMQDDGHTLKNPVRVDPSSVAHIPYSSGTTGLPKGVMVTHKGVTGGSMSSTNELVRVSDYNDTCIILLPMFHIYANFLTWCNVIAGCTSITLPRFTPDSLLSTIQKYRATYVPLVPPLVLFLLQSPLVQQYDLSSLENIMCGAAPVSASHLEQLIEKFKLKIVRQGYGMSEVCPISLLPRGQNDYLDSVGHPVAGTEIKIVDVNNGQALGIGQSGEICSKSPFQMVGYFNSPEATAATIDKDGWLHTGDIGYVNEKHNLYVVDRLKELIKYKGHQVAPAELETLLLSHPAVKDCAVIGAPDERAGELPRAYVVLDSSARSTTEEDIVNFVAGQTSREKHLHGGVIFLDQIPKSTSGKILRKNLKQLCDPKQ